VGGAARDRAGRHPGARLGRLSRAATVAAVAEHDGEVVGFCTLVGEPPVLDLGMVFVRPDQVGRGIGRVLWAHATAAATRLGAERMTIDADPHAEAFYLAMGAVRVGEAPSRSVPGRALPRLEHRPKG
jgi:predicted N-acetyltransferase YhbS